MTEQEGVIKFELRHSAAPPLAQEKVRAISAWRKVLYLTQLIGQDPARYGGYGFGNISCRMPPWDAPQGQRPFLISGTQTGGLTDLQPDQYAMVSEYDPARNLIVCQGPVRPSSESLTHGMVYDMDSSTAWVMHAHSPHIWRCAQLLGLPTTDPRVPYGSPEMAAEVQRLFLETDVATRHIFSMGGHEDGIVTFGPSAQVAGHAMLDALAVAFEYVEA